MPSIASQNGVDTPARHSGLLGGAVGLEEMLDAVLRRTRDLGREKSDMDRRLQVTSNPS